MQAFLVASDPDEREFLAYVLRRAGLAMATSADLQRVLASWTQHPADLIVVARDDGESLEEDLAEVRAVSPAPLLIIMDPPSEKQLCSLLEAGADLVLARPVSPRVLTTYAQVLLRRAGAVPAYVLPTLEMDEIALDPATRTVTVAGQGSKRLTQLEFRLLYVLMTNRDQVIPTEVIVERVWSYSGEGDRELVRGLVSRLRRKIELDASQPRFIQTIPGVGYRFTADED